MPEATGFKAKVSIKRKRLPSSPINVRISATPEENAEGGTMGSRSPGNAEKAAFNFPSSPKPKVAEGGATSARRRSYR